jgi:hypothetical protein
MGLFTAGDVLFDGVFDSGRPTLALTSTKPDAMQEMKVYKLIVFLLVEAYNAFCTTANCSQHVS